MNGWSVLLLVLIIAGFLMAVRSIWRNKDNPCGGCSGDCSSCKHPNPPEQAEK
ncbi:FeoB-associated Cys-rich membrane protein [Desulfitobacterium hafniense]|uniref:FeoB-associated Cys-rich membrane protein n=1 Tax=Desulfitobacterium hafniense TaxID=49338 RepID=UPI0002F7479B|nr:FeoB-associated Cys-rich membrane protein [Desulfitobacterium hafniense]